jgi:hypothetical protein
VKGVHSLGSAGCGEKRELEDLNCCRNRTWVWGYCVWRVDNQRDGSPCGLMALARGWSVAEIWNNKTYGWEVHPLYADG